MEKYPLKLIPYKKEVVWGGTRLRDNYGKDCGFDRLGETWELSVREKENSVIANGKYAGMTLKEYLGNPERFPLLVKFLDARDSLSVQVHPEKTEMWYIVEAEPDAKLVYGLKEKFDRETIDRAIAAGTLEEHLDYVNVKAGEVYFIPSGLVHAICAGIVIAEIQENSDTTYRLYDYMRPQPDGSLRQLHVTESLDTIRDFTKEEIEAIRYSAGRRDDATIADCEFFNVRRYVVEGEMTLDNPGFLHILCLSGSGEVSGEHIAKGDGYYIPEGMDSVALSSPDKLEVLVSIV
ncbi:MAG: class I mannose-6-phosphate isomerase [Clostridia bacterium]|nr:class I mannose-6-phosphate isomerase [Clostridia bacterium]